MACPRCRLRLSLSQSRRDILVPRRRAFHTSPTHKRMGAFTYPQEWQTGTYHFNKATQRIYPVAAQHTDQLLTQWLTQQKKRQTSDPEAAKLMRKGSIAAQRRKIDRVFASKSTAKDFGDRVVVEAFIYDGEEAAAKEEERKKQARMGVKPAGGEGGGRRRRPTRLRATGSSGAAGGAGGPGRTPGPRRYGGATAAGSPMGFKKLVLANAAGGATAAGSPTGSRRVVLANAAGGATAAGSPTGSRRVVLANAAGGTGPARSPMRRPASSPPRSPPRAPSRSG